MLTRRSRRRRSRYALPRQARLAVTIAVLALIILGIVFAVRGCRGRPAGQPEPEGTPEIQITPVPEVTPEPERTPEPEATPEPRPAYTPDAELMAKSLPFGKRSAVIRSIGDIVMHVPLLRGAYSKQTKTYDFSPYFSRIKASMEQADYTVINVDGPLGGRKFGSGSYKGYPQFNTPPVLLNTLADCGVDMLTLANNHALDTYYDGLVATIDNVDKVGLDHVGAYRSQQERDTPKVVLINGIRVGFGNYTVSTNNMSKRSDPAATQYGLGMVSNSNAPQDIRRMREAGAEIVVMYMHWGEEYERSVQKAVKSIASKLVAAGADVVIGGHQHVVLPCEYLTVSDEAGEPRTGLVLYGMGNFLSDQRQRYRDSGIIFEITLRDDPASGAVVVEDSRYIPTYVQRIKGESAYDYRVWPVGKAIEEAPGTLPAGVLDRMKQVWKEQAAIFEGGPATAAKS